MFFMKIISVLALQELLRVHGLEHFLLNLIMGLRRDYSKWELFTKMPRPAMHVPGGVVELMPICDNERYYAFKYVNCHPKNTKIGKQTVVATGQLSRIDTGYPLLFSEMTLLTALRTAATSALATDLLAPKDASVVAIIGTGAQSEFQLKALQQVRSISEVRFYDIDPLAMNKFARNLQQDNIIVTQCKSVEEAVTGVDIITVCTAAKARVSVLHDSWISNGVHINAIGGDTVGKTELEKALVARCKVAIEYFDQTFIEGEIQQFTETEARELVKAELHQLVREEKKVRTSKKDITLFDSVGIALEDYTALRLTYELSEQYGIGQQVEMTPVMDDPKNLIGTLSVTKAEKVVVY